MNINSVSDVFEEGFMSNSLETQIEGCDMYELRDTILNYVKSNQPVLEAGCGAGRWMHFLKRHNIEAIGLDWSSKLKEISERYDPKVKFDNGDLRQMPYPNEIFGAILALGSIEHVIEGPEGILREFFRVLKKGGIGIISVPYNSIVRKYTLNIKDRIKDINIVRRIFKKNLVDHKQLSEMYKKKFRKDVYMEISTRDKERKFFEYQFTKNQFKEELENVGFKIIDLYSIAFECGLQHNLSSLVGKIDDKGNILFNLFGKLLLRILSANSTGHMICAIVRKSE